MTRYQLRLVLLPLTALVTAGALAGAVLSGLVLMVRDGLESDEP